ncbi:MAG: multicopper oxidase domain-containing protein [Desulfobacterales bacterium]
MKKKPFKMTRRQVLKAGLIGGAGIMLPLRFLPRKAFGEAAAAGLSDPAMQPKFVEFAPNALDPGFLFKDLNVDGKPAQKPNFSIRAAQTVQETGLINPKNGRRLKTPLWGYGSDTVTWPGQTIQVMSVSAGGDGETKVRWTNELQGKKHLLPVDTNLHWCYALHGHSSANGVDYRQYSIKRNGVPIITHLHGGASDFQFDGNPEFFYSPDGEVKGPQWDFAPDGFTNTFRYNNDVPAGNLWYHDHALGITRLNVYAGLAGFYFVRDELDTGLPDNPLGLPAFPYELAYAIQDRMFTDKGALFYSAFPGDPFYDDFITDEGAILPPDLFPDGGPTALAEFFGDHMVVNGKIWPKENVEPRNYRMRLLNGTDSRFMGIRFRAAATLTSTDLAGAADVPIPFYVIGSDQGLASSATQVGTLVFEPGSRYDIVFDFKNLQGQRIIMENIGGDAPFGGDLFGDLTAEEIEAAVEAGDLFPNRQTDRIMAFDVADMTNQSDGFNPDTINQYYGNVNTVIRTRKVALFEGKDEFGRLQPLLGTAEPATDYALNPINWPNTPVYYSVGLVGPMEGSIAWHSPTTENPAFDSTEEWEIWNMTGDAHPVHLHLVNFEILGRQEINFDSKADEDGFISEGISPAGDGVYLVPQTTVQHNSVAGDLTTYGKGFKIVGTGLEGSYGDDVNLNEDDGYVENAPKDMVTALPGQITRIKATFDKPGRYVWHCHILSHEDHEMMRVLEVTDPSA